MPLQCATVFENYFSPPKRYVLLATRKQNSIRNSLNRITYFVHNPLFISSPSSHPREYRQKIISPSHHYCLHTPTPTPWNIKYRVPISKENISFFPKEIVTFGKAYPLEMSPQPSSYDWLSPITSYAIFNRIPGSRANRAKIGWDVARPAGCLRQVRCRLGGGAFGSEFDGATPVKVCHQSWMESTRLHFRVFQTLSPNQQMSLFLTPLVLCTQMHIRRCK